MVWRPWDYWPPCPILSRENSGFPRSWQYGSHCYSCNGWPLEPGIVAGRSAPRVKTQLRSALLSRLTLDPGAASGPGTGAVATLAGRGIDALDAYYSLYLPQRLLAVIVPFAGAGPDMFVRK